MAIAFLWHTKRVMALRSKVHFIGIGGIGMSGLARYFKAAGWQVSGSDLQESSITQALGREGIKIKIGHKEKNLPRNTALIIYNRAISLQNPELKAARTLRLPSMSYADALGKLTERYTTIAITGSHGKSTTTALAGLALMKGGLDPTILVGTNLKELGGRNIRIGKSPYLVLEADDFGGAFLHYSPSIAIVTNIDKEHLDFYKSFKNIKNAFLKFLGRTRPGGILILNRDDKILLSLRDKIVSIAKHHDLKIVWYSLNDNFIKKIRRGIAIPGVHNLSNAAAAYVLGSVLRVPEKKIIQSFGSYRGAWRRMEFRGRWPVPGVAGLKGRAFIYDDYAHHPTEIKATLQAFREKFPRSPLVCVFEPHQGKRLIALFPEFVKAFGEADITVILPLYAVPGRDEVFAKDSAVLVRTMQKQFPKKKIFYCSDSRKLKALLAKKIADFFAMPTLIQNRNAPPVIIMMGAGDIVNLTQKLIT